jgi:hypothetical protein
MGVHPLHVAYRSVALRSYRPAGVVDSANAAVAECCASLRDAFEKVAA